jgi:hypothetical protein
MEKDQRRRTRISIQLTVHVRVKGEDVAVTSKNLSLKGLLCSPDPRLQQGEPCQVIIQLIPRLQVVIQGRILRTNPQETAIDFLAMDEQSFTHLKKIIEYNTGDADRISEELLQPAFVQTPERNE